MAQEKYNKIQRKTIQDEYSMYSLARLLNKLEDDNLIRNDKRRKKNETLLDITKINSEREKVSFLFDRLPLMVKKCEEFEYDRAYRYIYLYKFKQINLYKLEELLADGIIQQFTEGTECDDYLSRVVSHPTYREIEDIIYLKFSMELNSKLANDESIKHVILVVIHKNNNLIEVRQDVIPIEYNPKERFYNINARSVKGWLNSYLDAEIENIDLQAITKYMKSTKQEDVKITALSLKRNGMTAELDSANNSELMLPILDELRNMIDTEQIFLIDKNTITIKGMLENFIEEIEETSDLPAAKILWLDNGYKVNAYHGDVEGDIPFLRWIGELKDKESIDYVTNYIINCERELREEFED